MLSQEEHPLKVMGDPALQKESSHSCLYKQVNFISNTISPTLAGGC